MNEELTHKLKYSYPANKILHPLPLPLKDSLTLISDFFANNTSNKLCLVFPSKELAAQWLSIPTVFHLIKSDFVEFNDEIFKSYTRYKYGEKLLLNNKAVVEWVGIRSNGVTFKTKGVKDSSGAEITIRFSDVIMLQKAPASRKVLSSLKSVKEALPSKSITPTERLLDIETYGNKEFIKHSICLVGKYKKFIDSTENILLNSSWLPEYFQPGKIDESGNPDSETPLLLSNTLSNLALFLSHSKIISKIVIDGFSAIHERPTDFVEIDSLNIPTILITDLTEIDSFQYIGRYGFEFFNFTKENLRLDTLANGSPFQAFNKKLDKYISFKLIKEICFDAELEALMQKLHLIEKDDSNKELNSLRISLVQICNFIARICHKTSNEELSVLRQKIESIETAYIRNRMWLGSTHTFIAESITIINSYIAKLADKASEKCIRLSNLLQSGSYNYIICPSEDEAHALRFFLSGSKYLHVPKVISVADVNDSLLTYSRVKALITGWAKSTAINRILSSFLFSELTVLFYHFENKYYNSLQRRNRQSYQNIKPTFSVAAANRNGAAIITAGFDDFYSDNDKTEIISDPAFDIAEFELKLDQTQYAKYAASGSLIESVKAKRIDFEDNFFLYSTESHKFLVINELVESSVGVEGNIFRRKPDFLACGDVIALINTDRDILAELVKETTKSKDYEPVNQWIALWKDLLKTHYARLDFDFRKLVAELRDSGCKKHEVTIKTWLQDSNRIGPDDNADLRSIALMTNSKLLFDNVDKVRDAISKMTGWRMRASDFIISKIKAKIHEYTDQTVINRKIIIDGLGSVIVLKIADFGAAWESIDVRYVNRLLQKEII